MAKRFLSWIEEADTRLVVHVEWAICVQKFKRVVIVSNDTDTFALLLYYTPYFQELGMKEIWQQYGTGEKRRMLPLHQAVSWNTTSQDSAQGIYTNWGGLHEQSGHQTRRYGF